MQLSLSFRRAKLVAMGFQNLADEIPKVGRKPIYNVALEVVRRMKEYPSRVSTYIRSYLFRAGWSIEKYDLGYRILNWVPYGHFVVGNAFGVGQAWMHVGVWRPFREVTEEEANKLPEAVRDELTLAIRRSFSS